MGKFSRNREYTFASLEDMITDIIETFDWNELSHTRDFSHE